MPTCRLGAVTKLYMLFPFKFKSLGQWFLTWGVVWIICKIHKKYLCEEILWGEIQARMCLKSPTGPSDFHMHLGSIGPEFVWALCVLVVVQSCFGDGFGLLLGISCASCVSVRWAGRRERWCVLSSVSSAFLGKSERELINQGMCPTGHLFYVPQVTTKFECCKYQPISLNRLKKKNSISRNKWRIGKFLPHFLVSSKYRVSCRIALFHSEFERGMHKTWDTVTKVVN